MNKLILFIAISLSIVNATDNVWSKDTQTISESKSDEIIKTYNQEHNSKLNFEDDIGEKKSRYGYNKTILTIGLGIGSINYNETTTNSYTTEKNSYTSSNIKLTIGKDFTFLHKEQTQPTRIFFTYAFEKLENDLDFVIWTLGIRENMEYWPFYIGQNYKIYPTISLEVGKATLEKLQYDISGVISQVNLGATYAYKNNFEYFVNISYDYAGLVNKQYDDNIDRMNGFGINIGVTYKILYDD